MSMKKVITILMTTFLTLNIFGCNSKVSYKEMEEMKESVTLANGLTINELEDKIMKLVYFVYTPQSEEDIQKGIDSIKDILTESEYNTLCSESRYNEETSANMSDLEVKYSSVKNNSDGLDRIYVVC